MILREGGVDAQSFLFMKSTVLGIYCTFSRRPSVTLSRISSFRMIRTYVI